MSAKPDNVVQLFRHGFPARDVEMIETLLLLVTGGDEVPIDDVAMTPMTLSDLVERFGVGPDMELKGLAMPVSRWQFPLETRALELFVVDAGGYRAFYYRPDADFSALPMQCDIRS